jgi:predicted GNAT family acetyltransferase
MRCTNTPPLLKVQQWKKANKDILRELASFKEQHNPTTRLESQQIIKAFKREGRKDRECYYYIEKQGKIIATFFSRGSQYRLMTTHPSLTTEEIDTLLQFLENWLIKRKRRFNSISGTVPEEWKRSYLKCGYTEKFSRTVYSLSIKLNKMTKNKNESSLIPKNGKTELYSLEECWNKKILEATAECITFALIDSIDARIGHIKKPRIEDTAKELKALKGELNKKCSSILMIKGQDSKYQVVGVCLITSWEGSHLIYLVAVYPRYRNKGIATTLLKRSISTLHKEGHRELFLFLTEGNNTAKHIYERLGFQPIYTMSYMKRFL